MSFPVVRCRLRPPRPRPAPGVGSSKASDKRTITALSLSLAVACLLSACRDSKAETPPSPPVRAAAKAVDSLTSFSAALCPLPPRDGFLASSQCWNQTRGRARCLEILASKERAALIASDGGETWWDLDGFYEQFARARCSVDEAVHWVEVTTREWSDGTAEGLRESWCQQRMLEERLFFHAARKGPIGDFWKLVEARQTTGLRARERLGRLRAAAGRDPVVSDDPVGSLRPERWREFVHQLDLALDRPAILAAQHCGALPTRQGCKEKLELYFHSIGWDAAKLDDCR